MGPPCGTFSRAREKPIPQWMIDKGVPRPAWPARPRSVSTSASSASRARQPARQLLRRAGHRPR
eukprot:2298684-Heterocapsa_arctica.AAC.1